MLPISIVKLFILKRSQEMFNCFSKLLEFHITGLSCRSCIGKTTVVFLQLTVTVGRLWLVVATL